MKEISVSVNKNAGAKRGFCRCAIALSGLALGLVGCGGGAPAAAGGEGEGAARVSVRVVATTGMIADVARNVAAPGTEVVQLMASGTDPHLYKPTRGDVIKLSEADTILYNGLHLEGKMGEVLERMAGDGKGVYAVAGKFSQADTLLIDGDLVLYESTVVNDYLAEKLGYETLAHLQVEGVESTLTQRLDGLVPLQEHQAVVLGLAGDHCHLFGPDGRACPRQVAIPGIAH